jgi:hypothetical protein
VDVLYCGVLLLQKPHLLAQSQDLFLQFSRTLTLTLVLQTMDPPSQIRGILILPIGARKLLQETVRLLEILLQLGGEFEELFVFSLKTGVFESERLTLAPLAHQFLRVLLQSRHRLEDVALDESSSTLYLSVEDSALTCHLRHLLAALLHPRQVVLHLQHDLLSLPVATHLLLTSPSQLSVPHTQTLTLLLGPVQLPHHLTSLLVEGHLLGVQLSEGVVKSVGKRGSLSLLPHLNQSIREVMGIANHHHAEAFQ